MTTAKRRNRKAPVASTAPESSGQADNSTVAVNSNEEPSASEAAPIEQDTAAALNASEEAMKEPSADMDDLLVDEKMLQAEEAAREETKDVEKPRTGGGLTHERLQKLDVLLDQAQMYSKFLTEQVETIQNQIEQPKEESPEKQGGKRKAKRSSPKSKSKRAKGTTISPTASMLPLIEGELRPYQLKGITWLISLWTNGMNGILADQMGLGKTVQTIGFLSHLRENGINGPFLIVVPLSTLSNWKSEVSRWCPSMSAIVYHGDKNERLEMEQQWLKTSHGVKCPKNMPVVVTSYEIAIRDRKALQKVQFKYMVIDEGHRLKNSNCRLVRELKQIPAENKLLLTGTPLQNNLAELWSLLNFLLPAVFNNLEDFESWFDFSHVVSSNAGASEHASRDILEAEAKNRMVSKLHDILKPFLLRRVKSDVENSLPPKREIVLYAPLTSNQLEIEKKLVNKTLVSEIQEQLASKNGRSVDVGRLNNILMQLRKNCNHPDLITSEWEESSMFPSADVLVEQCGKMQVLDRLLTRLHKAGHKVLIFSQFTRMLDVLDAYLEDRGHHVARIDGSMSYHQRMDHIETFNTNPDCFAFLLSTRAGGLGLNLTSADTVIIYDSDWNPHQDMQAMDRAHRIGQTKPVLVLRLCTCNSVEVKLLQRATSKLALERLVIKKGAFIGDAEAAENKGVSLNAQDLLDVLKGNLRLEGKQQNEMVSDEMMDTLLDRSHLSAATCPYADSGQGYEVVQQHSGGLLSSVQ